VDSTNDKCKIFAKAASSLLNVFVLLSCHYFLNNALATIHIARGTLSDLEMI
jgi:hypothetical protein